MTEFVLNVVLALVVALVHDYDQTGSINKYLLNTLNLDRYDRIFTYEENGQLCPSFK